MFNAKQLLNHLVQTKQGTSGMPFSGTSYSQQNTGIGGMLSNAGGLLKNPAVSGALGGIGGGLLSGVLLNSRNTGKIAGGLGAAVLGGVALSAYKTWQTNKAMSQAPQQQYVPQQQQYQYQQQQYQPQQYPHQQQHQSQPNHPSIKNDFDFDAMPAYKQDEHSKAMLAAIIAVAKADGHFDERERKLIREETEKLYNPEASVWVQHEIYKPLDVKNIAGLATSEEMAAEIYFVSLMAGDRQNELDVKYLESLAKELKLDPQLKLEIERQLA